MSHPLGMALAAAGWAVGLRGHDLPMRIPEGEGRAQPVDDPTLVDPDELRFQACRADGQSRAAAALWYAARATPESARGLRFLSSSERYGLPEDANFPINLGYRQPASSVIYYRTEALVALELLQLDPDQVGAVMADRWSDVTDPSTTTEDLAGWIGLTVPQMTDADEMGTIPCP